MFTFSSLTAQSPVLHLIGLPGGQESFAETLGHMSSDSLHEPSPHLTLGSSQGNKGLH